MGPYVVRQTKESRDENQKFEKILLNKKLQYKRRQYHAKRNLTREENECMKAALAAEDQRNATIWDTIRINLMKGEEREEMMSSEKTDTEADISARNRKNGQMRRKIKQQRFGTKVSHAGAEKRFRHFVEFTLSKSLAELCGQSMEEVNTEFEQYENRIAEKESEEIKKAIQKQRVRDKGKDRVEEGDTSTQKGHQKDGEESEEEECFDEGEKDEDEEDAEREESDDDDDTGGEGEEEVETYKSVSVVELKKRLEKEGLSQRGKKKDLWERWKEFQEKERSGEANDEEQSPKKRQRMVAKEGGEERMIVSRKASDVAEEGRKVIDKLRRATMGETAALMAQEKKKKVKRLRKRQKT